MIRGYSCCGIPMTVTMVRKPSRYLVVRYRRCSVCNSRIITEEKISQRRKPRKPIVPTNGPPPDEQAD